METGARAAALGGYTAVLAMPNTEPAIDCAATAQEVLALGRSAPAEVAVAGAITVGRAGKALAPMGELAGLGVRIFTDDGSGVQDGGLMRRALDYAKGLGVTLAQHCEDESLAAGGAMHEGSWSSRLGLPGHPRRGRGGHGRPRHPARAAHRRPGALPAPLDRRIGGPRPVGQGRGAAGHRRGRSPPHGADPRRGGGLRPGVQGEPAATHRRRRGGGRRRAVRRHHRRRGDRSRPPCAGVQGRAVRPGTARDARPRRRRSRSPGRSCRRGWAPSGSSR